MKKGQRLSKRQISNIMKELLKGTSQSYLARKYKVTSSCISNHSRRHLNIKLRSGEHLRKWTVTTIDNYLIEKESTVRRVSMSIGHCKTPMVWKCTLCDHKWGQSFDSLKRRVDLNPDGCESCGRNQHTLYHDLLKGSLDSRAAYFLGVFNARGTVRGNAVKITSNRQDILECVRELICSDHPIKKIENAKGDLYTLSFKSPAMARHIKELKADDKSRMPKGIDEDLASHFTRGLLDFKGHMELLETSGELSVRVNITGPLDFLTSLKKMYAKLHPNVKSGYITTYRAPEWHFSGKKSPYTFLNWTYNSYVAPIKYIDTNKYDKFLYLKRWFAKRDENDDIAREYITEYKRVDRDCHRTSMKRIAKDLGIKECKVQAVKLGEIPKFINRADLERIQEKLKINRESRIKKREILASAMASANITKGRFHALAKEM